MAAGVAVRPVFEHGQDEAAALSGHVYHCGVVFLAFGSFALVVGLRRRVELGGNEGGKEVTFLNRWLPPRCWNAPLMDLPERQSVGASPA